MSDQLQAKKNAAPVLTEAQKEEYTQSLKNRFLEEGGIEKSRDLHNRLYNGNTRIFETNLFDALSIKQDSQAGFVQRAKELIANRDSYAYTEHVERSVNQLLDSKTFAEGEATKKFYVGEELNEKQIKSRQKEIVKEVNSHGIESLTNIADIISWMAAHITIKGDDQGQFGKILDTLRGVQLQFVLKARKEDMLVRINDLSDAINTYLLSHSKKPYTTKGKERIAICQALMALTGKMYMESEKGHIEEILKDERQATLQSYDKKGNHLAKKPEDLISRTDMKNWMIAFTENNNDANYLAMRDSFLDLFYLAENPRVEISGQDALIRAARAFKTHTKAAIKEGYFQKEAEVEVLIKEADRIIGCMTWSREHGGAMYKESLINPDYTPEVMECVLKINEQHSLPGSYVKSLDEKANKDINSYIEEQDKKNKNIHGYASVTKEKKDLLIAALEDEEINNLVEKLRTNPGLRKLKNGSYEPVHYGGDLQNWAKYLNNNAKSCILKIFINKNDEKAYEQSSKDFLEYVVGTVEGSLEKITFTEEMESLDWYQKNAGQIEQLCSYGEFLDEMAKNAELAKVYGMLDEKKRADIAVHADFWKVYRQRMAAKLFKEKKVSHPALSKEELEGSAEDQKLFEEKKKALFENEKGDEKKSAFRAKNAFNAKAIPCFAKIREEKSKIPQNLKDDYLHIEGVISLLNSDKDKVISGDIGACLAVLEKFAKNLNIEAINTLIEACKAYGESILGEEKTKFDKEYGYINNPQKYFDLSEEDITELTTEVKDTSKLTTVERIYYDLPLEKGGDIDEAEYIKAANECNSIVLSLMKDKEVLRYICQHTPDMTAYIQQIDINYANISPVDIQESVMVKKWLENPEKYGFKEKGGPDDLTVEKLLELNRAQKRKYFHSYIYKCYQNVLNSFISALSNGKYDGSEENRLKYKAMIEKLDRNQDVLRKLGSKPTTYVTRAIDQITHHKDFIPEEGETKSSRIETYKGIEDTYRGIFKNLV